MVGKRNPARQHLRDAAVELFRDRRTQAVGIAGAEQEEFAAYRNVLRSPSPDVNNPPDQFRGIPIRWFDLGGDFVLGSTVIEMTLQMPPTLGSQIKNHDDAGAWGTLGCFLDYGNEPVLLTNNHVIANFGSGAVGDDIVHPATLTDFVHIADLTDWRQLIPTPAYIPGPPVSGLNQVDAAIAAIPDGVEAQNVFRSDRDLPPLSAIADPLTGDEVQKVGAGSGHTAGKIEALSTVIRVRNGGSVYWFEDAIVIDSSPSGSDFAIPGDSGAVVFTVDDAKTACTAVALVYAMTETTPSGGAGLLKRTIACAMNDVLDAMNCSDLYAGPAE